ncbi:general stress protein [Peribacillus frigoritolerans]|nr:pyridoxamine 5'-phosphate oxidase family protein [Peribacillus frigoritolerans]TDL77806.1 general stress protein [Peribacillus frigoritolerans]
MDMSEAKEKVLQMFKEHKIGTLATIRQNKPFSRFMLFFHDELTLYTATNKDTHKAEDIESNPNVHVLLGFEGDGWKNDYAEIEGNASVEESAELKEKFWNKELKEWISGPDDPNYLLLKISPQSIRYYQKAGSKPEIIEL